MDEYSPAPWQFERSNGNWVIRDANGNALQCDETYYPWVSGNEADWHLIAAAPDLLEACRLALGAFERNECIDWNILKTAISKAEGKK